MLAAGRGCVGRDRRNSLLAIASFHEGRFSALLSAKGPKSSR
jgi:hypothetical protein